MQVFQTDRIKKKINAKLNPASRLKICHGSENVKIIVDLRFEPKLKLTFGIHENN